MHVHVSQELSIGAGTLVLYLVMCIHEITPAHDYMYGYVHVYASLGYMHSCYSLLTSNLQLQMGALYYIVGYTFLHCTSRHI
jgi:hypothetical protein